MVVSHRSWASMTWEKLGFVFCSIYLFFVLFSRELILGKKMPPYWLGGNLSFSSFYCLYWGNHLGPNLNRLDVRHQEQKAAPCWVGRGWGRTAPRWEANQGSQVRDLLSRRCASSQRYVGGRGREGNLVSETNDTVDLEAISITCKF